MDWDDQTQLPQDIITNQIFTRLPVKYLTRCKSVCKRWNFIISSPHFSNSYLKLSPLSNKQYLLINARTQFLSLDFEDYKDDCSYVSSDYEDCYNFEGNGATFTAIPDDDFPVHSRHRLVTAVASCNGLVCLESLDGFLYVWNPVIRKHIEIPYPEPNAKGRDVWGLGYVASAYEYKLVRIPSFPLKKIQIYSFVESTWKATDLDSADYGYGIPMIDRPGLWFDDMLVWSICCLGPGPRRWDIIGLDLINEKFMSIYDPKCLPYHDYAENPIIFVKDGCLHLCAQTDEGEFNIGFLKKEDGRACSFTWLHRFKHDSFLHNVGARSMYVFEMLGVTKTGRYVIHVDQETILLLDPCKDPPEDMHFLKMYRTRNVINFVQSLVSPINLVGTG